MKQSRKNADVAGEDMQPTLNCYRDLHLQGHNPHHQLETIVSVLGLPPEEQLSFVTHPAARKAIMSRANAKPKDLESYFPADASPLALDLLRRMVSARRSNTSTHGTRPNFFVSFRHFVSSRRKFPRALQLIRGLYLLAANVLIAPLDLAVVKLKPLVHVQQNAPCLLCTSWFFTRSTASLLTRRWSTRISPTFMDR